MKCPECGFNNPENARFCAGCGIKLELSLKNKTESGPENSDRRKVAVVFADLTGFTSLSENLDPEEVADLINDIFQRLGDVIKKYEGYIDKYMGDCVMALFGAPFSHEDDPLRSVLCGMEMMGAMKDLKGLSLSIGINYGMVLAGKVGSEQKMEYTVMGDTVNLAQRLESVAEKGQILVSEKIWELTKDQILYKNRGTVSVKGRKAEVNIYEPEKVIKLHKEREHYTFKIVGRKRELGILKKLFDKSIYGKPQSVLIKGEAGIGKSKLVYEFRRTISADVDIIECRGIEYLQGSPFRGLRELFKSFFKITDNDSPKNILRKLDAFVNRLDNFRKQWYFLVKYFFSLPLDEKEDKILQAMNPEDRIRIIQEMFFSMIKEITEKNKCIFIFEDSHWLDEETLQFSFKILSEIKKGKILLLHLTRPDTGYPELAEIKGAVTINLSSLSEKEIAELVSSIFNCRSISRKLNGFLISKSGSNPFFVRELAQLLKAEEMIIINNKTAELKETGKLSIPENLNKLIISRIDKLNERLKMIIQAASVIGKDFSSKLLDNLIEFGAELSADLEIIEEKDLIENVSKEFQVSLTDRDDYSFKHIITRDTVYESILIKKRKEYHKNLGALMAVSYTHLTLPTKRIV